MYRNYSTPGGDRSQWNAKPAKPTSAHILSRIVAVEPLTQSFMRIGRPSRTLDRGHRIRWEATIRRKANFFYIIDIRDPNVLAPEAILYFTIG